MTFIGYEIGSKAYKFMRNDNTIFIGVQSLFDETKFPQVKTDNGNDKLFEHPPGIDKLWDDNGHDDDNSNSQNDHHDDDEDNDNPKKKYNHYHDTTHDENQNSSHENDNHSEPEDEERQRNNPPVNPDV